MLNFSSQSPRYTACCETMPDIGEEALDLLWLHHTTQPGLQTAKVESGGKTFTMTYTGDTLPVLGHWELVQERDFVLALEPTNTHLQGQDWEKKNGSLRYLAPDEQVKTRLEFTF